MMVELSNMWKARGNQKLLPHQLWWWSGGWGTTKKAKKRKERETDVTMSAPFWFPFSDLGGRRRIYLAHYINLSEIGFVLSMRAFSLFYFSFFPSAVRHGAKEFIVGPKINDMGTKIFFSFFQALLSVKKESSNGGNGNNRLYVISFTIWPSHYCILHAFFRHAKSKCRL